jgi:hypothetical protein
MKRLTLPLAFSFALLLGTFTPSASQAARPNPPTLAGTVPATRVVVEPGGTNSVVIPPRVLVIDERGNTVADVETTVLGLTGTFSIPLKKAGTYVIVGYYPDPNRIITAPQAVDVFRKQTTTVSLVWPPQ